MSHTVVQPELLKGLIKNAILSVLVREDMHGYSMIREIRDRTNGTIVFSEASMYPALHALEDHKMVRSYWAVAETGRERKYYAITVKGKKALRSATQEWRVYRASVDALLTGIRIG